MAIKELREIGDLSGSWSYYDGDSNTREKFEDIESILEPYKPEGYMVKVVDRQFEDHGRWSNYITKVYEVTEGDEVAYFEYGEERPATEMQEGMDLSFHFQEVIKKEVVTYRFLPKN